MDTSDPSYKGQSGYNAAMLAIYDVWVLKFIEMSFSAVDIDVVGSAGLFTAAGPRSRSTA